MSEKTEQSAWKTELAAIRNELMTLAYTNMDNDEDHEALHEGRVHGWAERWGDRVHRLFPVFNALESQVADLTQQLADAQAKAALADEIATEIRRDRERDNGIPWGWYMRWLDRYDALPSSTSTVTDAQALRDAEAALREILRHLHEEPSSEDSITSIARAYFATHALHRHRHERVRQRAGQGGRVDG